MENTTKETALLLDRAKAQIVENMKEKGIGAIFMGQFPCRISFYTRNFA